MVLFLFYFVYLLLRGENDNVTMKIFWKFSLFIDFNCTSFTGIWILINNRPNMQHKNPETDYSVVSFNEWSKMWTVKKLPAFLEDEKILPSTEIVNYVFFRGRRFRFYARSKSCHIAYIKKTALSFQLTLNKTDFIFRKTLKLFS